MCAVPTTKMSEPRSSNHRKAGRLTIVAIVADLLIRSVRRRGSTATGLTVTIVAIVTIVGRRGGRAVVVLIRRCVTFGTVVTVCSVISSRTGSDRAWTPLSTDEYTINWSPIRNADAFAAVFICTHVIPLSPAARFRIRTDGCAWSGMASTVGIVWCSTVGTGGIIVVQTSPSRPIKRGRW